MNRLSTPQRLSQGRAREPVHEVVVAEGAEGRNHADCAFQLVPPCVGAEYIALPGHAVIVFHQNVLTGSVAMPSRPCMNRMPCTRFTSARAIGSLNITLLPPHKLQRDSPTMARILLTLDLAVRPDLSLMPDRTKFCYSPRRLCLYVCF